MQDLSNIKSRLLAQQVEEQLLEYILSEPVLVGQKLLNIRRGAGTYVVSTTTPEDDPLGLGAVKDKNSLSLDLVDVRLMLEPGIAEMAALHATDEEIEQLEVLCRLVETKIRQHEPHIR